MSKVVGDPLPIVRVRVDVVNVGVESARQYYAKSHTQVKFATPADSIKQNEEILPYYFSVGLECHGELVLVVVFFVLDF